MPWWCRQFSIIKQEPTVLAKWTKLFLRTKHPTSKRLLRYGEAFRNTMCSQKWTINNAVDEPMTTFRQRLRQNNPPVAFSSMLTSQFRQTKRAHAHVETCKFQTGQVLAPRLSNGPQCEVCWRSRSSMICVQGKSISSTHLHKRIYRKGNTSMHALLQGSDMLVGKLFLN